MTELDPDLFPDVLICGGGAAGLTLAIDLGRRGVSFRLIDKLPEPFPGSRGKGIQPRSQEVFEDLGVIDRIVAAGGTYPPQRVYRDDGNFEDSLVIEMGQPTTEEPYLIPLMVPQFLTEAVLRQRLAELGHRPELGCELTHFDQDTERVTAQWSLLVANSWFAHNTSWAPMAAAASCGTRWTSASPARPWAYGRSSPMWSLTGLAMRSGIVSRRVRPTRLTCVRCGARISSSCKPPSRWKATSI